MSSKPICYKPKKLRKRISFIWEFNGFIL